MNHLQKTMERLLTMLIMSKILTRMSISKTLSKKTESYWMCLSFYVQWKSICSSCTDEAFLKKWWNWKWTRVNTHRWMKYTLKLFSQFWGSIGPYSQGQAYPDVLKLLFNQFCKTLVQSHRRISNKNLGKN